jgi:hypothetical protein
MTTITDSSTNPYPAVSPPPGATANDDWQADDHQPYRVVSGSDRTVTDHKLYVSTSAVQWADGKVEDGTIEAPLVYVFDLGENAPLNSDQARELASVLLEAATEVDRWAAVSTPAVHPTPPQTPTLADTRHKIRNLFDAYPPATWTEEGGAGHLACSLRHRPGTPRHRRRG